MGGDVVYVIFRKRDERFVGHSISFEKPTEDTFTNWDSAGKKEKEHDEEGADQQRPSTFERVIDSFLSGMSTYRTMIPHTIEMSPVVSGIMANQQLGEYVRANGTAIEELERQDFSVFEVHERHFSSLVKRHREAVAAVNGAEHLPEIAVIGLISVYDAYLSKLLRVIFSLHEEMVLTSDREIKYSDLIEYNSIADAKQQIIEKDVEAILRNSHQEQFSWMQKKFSITLKSGLDIWPNFIELCERRNLLTHTGGHVSQQYVSVCAQHGYHVSASINTKLETDFKYFKNSVEIIAEIGSKLGHVLWRKFLPSEREKADQHLNSTCVDLISSSEYKTAEKLLDLGVNTFKRHGSDSIRRMMIINLANAKRLQEQKREAQKILRDEDWSASGTQFQICVAAVSEDIDALCPLMERLGISPDITAQEYREWPVFRGLRDNERFRATFERIFGEPLIKEDKNLMLSDINTSSTMKRSKDPVQTAQDESHTEH